MPANEQPPPYISAGQDYSKIGDSPRFPEYSTVGRTRERKRGQAWQVRARALAGNLPIHLPPIAYPHNEDSQGIVLDGTDNSVVSHAVFPEDAKARPLQRITNAARVVQYSNTFKQELKYPFGVLLIELVKLPIYGR